MLLAKSSFINLNLVLKDFAQLEKIFSLSLSVLVEPSTLLFKLSRVSSDLLTILTNLLRAFYKKNKKIIISLVIIGLGALAMYLIFKHYNSFCAFVELCVNHLLKPTRANKEPNTAEGEKGPQPDAQGVHDRQEEDPGAFNQANPAQREDQGSGHKADSETASSYFDDPVLESELVAGPKEAKKDAKEAIKNMKAANKPMPKKPASQGLQEVSATGPKSIQHGSQTSDSSNNDPQPSIPDSDDNSTPVLPDWVFDRDYIARDRNAKTDKALENLRAKAQIEHDKKMSDIRKEMKDIRLPEAFPTSDGHTKTIFTTQEEHDDLATYYQVLVASEGNREHAIEILAEAHGLSDEDAAAMFDDIENT